MWVSADDGNSWSERFAPKDAVHDVAFVVRQQLFAPRTEEVGWLALESEGILVPNTRCDLTLSFDPSALASKPWHECLVA